MFKSLAKIKSTKFITLISGFISIFIFSFIFTSQSTYAWTPGCTFENSAMYAACVSSISTPGAAWINGSQSYSTSQVATINDPNSSSTTVYLHGALWNGSSYKGSGAALWAVNVQLCTVLSSSAAHSDINNQCRNRNQPDYVTSYSTSFFRGYATSGWSNGQGSQSGVIEIDLNKFKASATHEIDGDYDKYTSNVWVARCASGSNNGTCEGSTYAADDSSIIIRIKRAIITTYQSNTTISIDGTNLSVNSGWDGFNSTSYSVDADTSEIYLSTHHQLRRTDTQNVRSDVGWLIFDQKNQQSGWSNKVFPTGNNRVETATTIKSEKISLSPGENLICRGIYHDSVILMQPDGAARAQASSGQYSKSNACITISRPVKTNPTASTTMQYIGEATSNGIQGAATFYTNLANPGDGSMFRTAADGDKEYFARDQETADSRDYQPDGSPSILCNHFRALGPYGCQSGTPNSIPDDANYLSAKICAIPAGKESEPNGKTKTVQRTIKTPEGTETQNLTIALHDYYWIIKSISCSPIAKKPSVSMQGGNTFSAGSIKTSRSAKYQGNTYGSWAEYLVISNQNIKNFASGAALRGGGDGSQTARLTISNTSSNKLGYAEIRSASDSFIARIKSRFADTGTYGNVWVYRQENNNLSIDNQFVTEHNLNNTNQLHIIIAKNIDIAESVTTINAWLIAENTINTCAGYNNPNDIRPVDDNCHQPLTINGIAYAKNFKLYRIAGANGSVGGNHNAEPAEIFNLAPYDFTQAYQQSANNSQKITEVYLQELAPRV